MPVELWSAVIAALAAVAGTLASGLVALRVAKSADRRTELRELRMDEREAQQRQRDLAEAVADVLRDQLVTIGQHEEAPEQRPFEDVFLDEWRATIKMQLQHRVDHLTDDALRERLSLVVRSVDDSHMLSGSGFRFEWYLQKQLSLGREICMAFVRGQGLSVSVQGDLDKLEGLAEHAKEMRAIEREWREDDRAKGRGEWS